MERNTSNFSLERILLVLIIGIGCLGLGYAFQLRNQSPETEPQNSPLSIQGTFAVNAPIRFSLNRNQFPEQDLEIDFGNGVSLPLNGYNFTFAYEKAGQYTVKIRQGTQVLYRRTLEIHQEVSGSQHLIVMN